MTPQTYSYICHAASRSRKTKVVFSVQAATLIDAVTLADAYAGGTRRILLSCRNASEDFVYNPAVEDAQKLINAGADAAQVVKGYFESETSSQQ